MENSNLSSVKSPNNASVVLKLVDFQLVYLTITFIITLLGNTLVLAAIYYDSRLRTVTNYFVACLAVSDILVACFSVSIRLLTFIVYKRSKEPFDEGILNLHVCRFWIWIDSFCEAASIYTLTVISIDRYFKISRPFQYRERMNKTVAVMTIVAIWVLAALLASLGLVPFGDSQGVKVLPYTCGNDNKIFFIMAAVLAFFFPLLILIIMYTLIFRIALYHFKKENAMTMVDPVSGKQLHYSAYKDLKATRTLFIVVSTFVICWGPFFVLFQIIQHQPAELANLGNTARTWLLVVFVSLLPYSNSFLNPIIYACFDRVYRRSFRKILFKMIGRSDMANAKEYNGRNRQRNTSVFELTIAQPHDNTNSSPKRDPASSLEDEECFYYDGSEKFYKNGYTSSPSGRLTNLTPLESDEMIVYEDNARNNCFQ